MWEAGAGWEVAEAGRGRLLSRPPRLPPPSLTAAQVRLQREQRKQEQLAHAVNGARKLERMAQSDDKKRRRFNQEHRGGLMRENETGPLEPPL